MNVIRTQDPGPGIEAMATRIADALGAGRKALWLVCGGSNISIAVQTMDRIRARTAIEAMENLTVGLTDERYGPVGHKDSNWQQLAEMGMNLQKVGLKPVLIGKSLEATVEEYERRIDTKFKDLKASGGIVVAMFGIGADGHIAGILPGSAAVDETRSVCGYKAGPYIRITLTPPAIERIDTAYAFVFGNGSAKEGAMRRLINEDLELDEQPSQVLKRVQEANLYIDTTIDLQ